MGMPSLYGAGAYGVEFYSYDPLVLLAGETIITSFGAVGGFLAERGLKGDASVTVVAADSILARVAAMSAAMTAEVQGVSLLSRESLWRGQAVVTLDASSNASRQTAVRGKALATFGAVAGKLARQAGIQAKAYASFGASLGNMGMTATIRAEAEVDLGIVSNLRYFISHPLAGEAFVDLFIRSPLGVSAVMESTWVVEIGASSDPYLGAYWKDNIPTDGGWLGVPVGSTIWVPIEEPQGWN